MDDLQGHPSTTNRYVSFEGALLIQCNTAVINIDISHFGPDRLQQDVNPWCRWRLDVLKDHIGILFSAEACILARLLLQENLKISCSHHNRLKHRICSYRVRRTARANYRRMSRFKRAQNPPLSKTGCKTSCPQDRTPNFSKLSRRNLFSLHHSSKMLKSTYLSHPLSIFGGRAKILVLKIPPSRVFDWCKRTSAVGTWFQRLGTPCQPSCNRKRQLFTSSLLNLLPESGICACWVRCGIPHDLVSKFSRPRESSRCGPFPLRWERSWAMERCTQHCMVRPNVMSNFNTLQQGLQFR